MHESVKIQGKMRHFGRKVKLFAINIWVFICPIRTNMLRLSSISVMRFFSNKSIIYEMFLSCVI